MTDADGAVSTGIALEKVRSRAPSRLAVARVTAQRLALPAVLTVAALVRVWELNQYGLNSDEAVYLGQGASISGHSELSELFPTFRSHPMLFQSILSLGFYLGGYDLFGRVISAGFGLATVFVAYKLGKLLYGWRAGVLSATFLALMPYHVLVTRQVLLDGPMVFFATLALYFVARYAVTTHPAWLYSAGAAMGLTFLSKETGILLVGSIYAFFALSPEIRVRVRQLALALVIMFVTIAPFPITMMLAGKSETGGQYLAWQLFRRPNHTWTFYLEEVPRAMGYLVIVVAIAGLVLLWHERTWRETLLISWIVVPVIFFELWPVKGFQYLLPTAPAVAILAARTLVRWRPERTTASSHGHAGSGITRALVVWLLVSILMFEFWRVFDYFAPAVLAIAILALLAVALVWGRRGIVFQPARLQTRHGAVVTAFAVCVGLFATSWHRIQPTPTGTLLAGSGGLPGGREAGYWLAENVPEGANFLTIGPSMANLVQYYGHRHAYGLSVSPNPLRRNPAYKPIVNPDLDIRNNELQYLVWDSFSADRSPFFGDKLLRYADRYNGRVIHSETMMVRTPAGSTAEKAVIVVYHVRPLVSPPPGDEDD